MDTYSLLREFADSWALLALTLFYITAILWVLRPSRTKLYRDVANIPFRYDDKPASGCTKSCEDCACGAKTDFMMEAK